MFSHLRLSLTSPQNETATNLNIIDDNIDIIINELDSFFNGNINGININMDKGV